MFPYIPNGREDIKEMLSQLGLTSLDELFSDIPDNVRLNKKLDIDGPLSEMELSTLMEELSKKNKTIKDLTCFLGAGAYDHYIPSVVNHVISRSEFYTSYTPYQAEISQGTLQTIFEYQTLICNLTDMDVANASIYDGATALAESMMMAVGKTRRKDVIVSKTVHPEYRRVLKTYARFQGINIVEVDMVDGETDREILESKMSKDIAAVIVQYPNFFGVIEEIKEIEKIAHSDKKTLFIMTVDPIALGLLESPGNLGADIVVGEGQSLGNPLNFGGPYLGFMAVKKALMRKMPGRIVGQTEDVDGKRSFVLTLQAREQHIRREKATSNICSNQALNALAAAVYMTVLGKEGIREVAEMSFQKAHYAHELITRSGKYRDAFNKPFFKEFSIAANVDAETINEKLYQKDILGGYLLEKDYPQQKDTILYCVTEKRTKKEIDTLVEVLEGIK
ncbi:aminomethyl-transferring glycine dehydrogenase subunit GcvPA [Clostridiisalibacter paucivorans]|uniref:aminomethyl-transferring glycine dehydrogenase subunit GcvPA n=1 Tax=Clostridiisalibacter paucivorans TaxID=408753 RepID=UPI000479F211|nr:aminomethyl-transferring glycine dehydrogenase subunit GcvPA [Clostridiisalibacter paucivorans]